MISLMHNLLNIIRCTNCKGKLLKKNEEFLVCKSCGTTYPLIEKCIPNLLSPKIRSNLARRTKTDVTFSIYSKKLDKDLKKVEKEIIRGIFASHNMMDKYREIIADPLTSIHHSAFATFSEKYEDLYLNQIINDLINKRPKNKIILIEAGSGPGRVLIRYGSNISKNFKASKIYKSKNCLKKLYNYQKEYDNRFSLIIGIDFEKDMLKQSLQWLRECNLEHLLNSRLFLICGAIQQLFLDFSSPIYKEHVKIVTSQFNTLGNQRTHWFRVRYLKSLLKLAKPKGIIEIGTFNAEMFHKALSQYYKLVTEAYGNIISTKRELEKGIIRTDKDIYTKWFSIEEFKKLLSDANFPIEDTQILTGDELPIWEEYHEYIPVKHQKWIRDFVIFATTKINIR